MKTTGGRHVHIGGVPNEVKAAILRGLADAGIDSKLFVHVSHVPSVWKAMEEYSIDLYLSSYPVGGGKATVEVLGSGTPVVFYESEKYGFLTSSQLGPPDSPVWRTDHELLGILGGAGADHLNELGVISRKWYERYYHPDLYAESLNRLLHGGLSLEPPPLRAASIAPLEFKDCLF
jgi:hypothetical protein